MLLLGSLLLAAATWLYAAGGCYLALLLAAATWLSAAVSDATVTC